MLGNTYDYASSGSATEACLTDINNAKAMGINGFTLNLGSESWQQDRMASMFEAAASVSDFTVYVNLDMSVLSCATSSDMSNLVSIVEANIDSAGQATVNGKPLVGTFIGESCTFGESDSNTGWEAFKSQLESDGYSIFFMPYFPVDAYSVYDTYTVADGLLKWNAWPYETDSIVSDSEDEIYIAQAKAHNKAYMATVSPWFFTHFSSKNYIYRSEDTWPTRWKQMLDLQPDFLQIISWNDYGESHDMGPINSLASFPSDSVSDSADWTKNSGHSAWGSQAASYISAYLAGESDITVSENRALLAHRQYFKNVTATGDSLSIPTYASYAQDEFVLQTFLLESTTAEISIGGSVIETLSIEAGNQVAYVPFPSSVTGNVTVTLENGCTISGTSFYGSTSPEKYNFNAYVRDCTW